MFPTFFKHKTIKDAGKVENVEIDIRPLNHILGGIGKSFPKLLDLRIKGDVLEKLERRVFGKLSQLEALDLSNMVIGCLESDALFDLVNLETLDLRNCKIDNLDKHAFKKLANLKSLNLNGNRLKQLQQGLFEFNPKLSALSVRNNKLNTIEVDFTAILNLKRIDLTENECIDENYAEIQTRLITKTSKLQFQRKVKFFCTDLKAFFKN